MLGLKTLFERTSETLVLRRILALSLFVCALLGFQQGSYTHELGHFFDAQIEESYVKNPAQTDESKGLAQGVCLKCLAFAQFVTAPPSSALLDFSFTGNASFSPLYATQNTKSDLSFTSIRGPPVLL